MHPTFEPDFDRGELDRYNTYVCRQCGGITLTAHAMDALTLVTPAMLMCRAKGINPLTGLHNCQGEAYSGFYPLDIPPQIKALPVWVFYKPTTADFEQMTPMMQYHIRRGGAALTSKPVE